MGRIVKRHFKFEYESPVHKDPLYVLLDVLYEENHYGQIIKKEIKNSLLLTDGENLSVQMPSLDCLLGDKLTAFAPHTTGVPIDRLFFGHKNGQKDLSGYCRI